LLTEHPNFRCVAPFRPTANMVAITEAGVGVERRSGRLLAIKLLHTVIWAFLAFCIVALPATAVLHRFDWAAALTLAVLLECAVLAVTRGRCPLTRLAAQYTEDREDNFDIFLPVWLARNNKMIFGGLFVAGEFFVLWCWLG
jgi:hypothetical protein